MASLLILAIMVLLVFPNNNDNDNKTAFSFLLKEQQQQQQQHKQQQQQHKQKQPPQGIRERVSTTSAKTIPTMATPTITMATGGLRGGNGPVQDISVELSGDKKQGLRQDLLNTLKCQDHIPEQSPPPDTNKDLRSGTDLVCQLALSNRHDHYVGGHDHSKLAGMLRIWKEARANLSTEQIVQTLATAREREIQLTSSSLLESSSSSSSQFSHTTLDIWVPPADDNAATTAALQKLDQQGAGYGITHHRQGLLPLGVDSLFVDVGAQWGLTTLSVLLHYRGTKVICLEASGPTWLLLHLNLLWNVPRAIYDRNVLVLPGGLGATDGQAMPLKSWKPAAAAAAAAATVVPVPTGGQDDQKQQEQQQEQQQQQQAAQEQLVHLWSLQTIRKLAAHHLFLTQLKVRVIDVLKLDCEGCEYTIIPNLRQEEKQSIRSIVLGSELHSHSIPKSYIHAPSLQAQMETHEFLCQYQAFATFFECCNHTHVLVIDDEQGRTMGELLGPTLCQKH